MLLLLLPMGSIEHSSSSRFTLKATEQLSLKCVDSEHLWDWGRLKPEFSAACVMSPLSFLFWLVLCHSRLIKGTSLPNIAAAAYRRRKALFGISLFSLSLSPSLYVIAAKHATSVPCRLILCTLCVCIGHWHHLLLLTKRKKKKGETTAAAAAAQLCCSNRIIFWQSSAKVQFVCRCLSGAVVDKRPVLSSSFVFSE